MITRRVPMQRRVHVGAAARRRIRAGGVLAKGRASLSLAEYRVLKTVIAVRSAGADGIPRCERCGTTRGPFDLDHVMLRSHGGHDGYSQCYYACRTCNELRHAPYATGRSVVTALGDGRFKFELMKGTKQAPVCVDVRWGGRAPTPEERAKLLVMGAA